MTGPFSLTIPDPLQVKPNSATIWCTCLGFDFDGDAVYTGDGQVVSQPPCFASEIVTELSFTSSIT